MYVLIGILAAVFILIAYMLVETRLIKVESVDFRENPGQSNLLKIIQLSDIHVNMNYINPLRLRKIIEAEDPDIIFLTGDYINTVRDIPKFIAYLRRSGISSRAAGKGVIFASLGNHDVRSRSGNKAGLGGIAAAIRAEGIILPEAQAATYTQDSKKISITAFPSFMPGQPAIDISRPTGCDLDIALSHNPDVILDQRKGAFDYMFSGHFHGGQIWAPFRLEYRLLRHERLCKMNICKGRFLINGINLYISRGIGDVVFPFRLLSIPEVTVIHIPL